MAAGVVQSVQKMWLSQAEVCVFLDCTDEWVRDHVRDSGEVHVSKEGGMYWYLLKDIVRFIERRSIFE